MDKKDKLILICSVTFLVLSIALFVAGGLGNIKRIFANWDDKNSDGDAKEYTEDWVATEVVGHPGNFGGNTKMSFSRVFEKSTADSPNGSTYTINTWVVSGYISEMIQWGIDNRVGFTSTTTVDPVLGSVPTLNWGSNAGLGGYGHLYSDEHYTIDVTKWRVYGHIHL